MPKKGFKQTKEHRLHISTSKKGISISQPPFSEEHRRNIGLANKGKKHYRWGGGNSRTIDKIIRQSIDYKIWRTEVFKRDNFVCKICGAHNGLGKKVVLNADHHPIPFSLILKQNKIINLKDALRCNILWDINNGRTLCTDCHKNTETFAGKIYKYGQ